MVETTVQVKTVVQADAPDGSPPVGIWSRPYRFLTLGLILTIVAAAFEQLSVATTMPAAVQDLGGLSLYGWAFSAFMLTMIISLTIGGSEADRSGPLYPFVSGVALFALGLVVAGFAPTMPILIVGRAIQGLGAGLVASIAYAVIGRDYPEAARPAMLALISSAYILPSFIGPALAGLVADYFGWRWVFLGLAPLLPLAAGLALSAMRRFEHTSNQPRDWGRIGTAVRLAAGTGLLMSGLASYQTIFLIIVLSGIGVALAMSAIRRLLPTGSQQASGLSAALFAAMLLNMAFFGVDAFVPLALTTVRGQTTSFAGLALTAASMSWVASSWLQAQLASRHSRRSLVTIGLGLVIAGIVGLVVILQPDIPAMLALLAWSVAGLGMGFASPTLTLLAMELAPSGQEGASTSAIGQAGILGIAVGTGIGGVIVGNTYIGSTISPMSVAGHSLLMVGTLIVALGVTRYLPDDSRKPGMQNKALASIEARAGVCSKAEGVAGSGS
jgi:MFS family permease